MEPQIVFEDEALLVINKPQGLLVHGDGRTDEYTLADWILKHRPEVAGVGEQWTTPHGVVIPRPGIVHRLDKETSGIMLVAKTQEMYVWLKAQFEARTIHKEYRALVHGQVIEEKGKIDKPIGKSASDFRKYSAQRGAKGATRDAITRYVVLNRIPDIEFPENKGKGYTLLAVFPLTGRTHQIRVHLKSIHHPIVCDALYGESQGAGAHFTTLALQAVRVEVPFKDGSTKTFSVPERPEFLALMRSEA